jgi:sulfonate transport system permease protein
MKLERFLMPVFLLVVWQALASFHLIPSYKLPGPLEIIGGLIDLVRQGMPPGHRLFNHLIHSLYRVAAGFVLAAGLGVPIGLIMGWSKRLNRLFGPLIEMVRPVPPLAWIPIAILWFGIGIKSAAFIIFLGVVFPIILNTVEGVVSVRPVLIEAARTLSATKRDILLKVLVPGAMPSIFVGLRIGLGIGWMTLVAAEFTGVKSGYGLGYMIMTARDIQRADEIIAGMVVIGLTGLLINIGLTRLQSVLVPWQRA